MINPLAPERLSPTVAALVEESQQSERAGQREVARHKYEAALHLLDAKAPGNAEAASALVRHIARTYLFDGQFDAALDCWEAGLAMAECGGDTSGVAHALNGMAIAHGHRGDSDRAAVLYERALQVAIAAADEPLCAMIAQNLGNAASVRGDFGAALGHFRSSFATYQRLGLREHLGPVLNNMALVFTHLEQLDEAQAAYDEALLHCTAMGDTPNRLLALVNSTGLWIARGDLDRAAALCERVQCEATDVGDRRSLAEVNKHMGVIARLRGNAMEAELRLAVAYDEAMNREDLLLAAETAREQAALYESMDRSEEVLRALSRSHRLFTKLRAQRDLADLQQRVGRLERQFYDIVRRWAHSIESKDVYTAGHCERVADYACALARDVGYDDITMFWFRIGALLHDVGKIETPSEILNKPGRLTAEERAIMERHPAVGSDMLADIDFPWNVLPIVRNHHERWDGKGYPDQLAGDAIDLSARIVCIADVFDALTTDRPYRKGFSVDEALAMMGNDVGTMFDPELFPRFVRVIRGDAADQPQSQIPRATRSGREWSRVPQPSAA